MNNLTRRPDRPLPKCHRCGKQVKLNEKGYCDTCFKRLPYWPTDDSCAVGPVPAVVPRALDVEDFPYEQTEA